MFDAVTQRCSLYVHRPVASGQQSLASYAPGSWEHNQYAVELWLQRAVRDHPWRVDSVAKADAILIDSNFSMWCVARKMFSARRVWKGMLEDRLL